MMRSRRAECPHYAGPVYQAHPRALIYRDDTDLARSLERIRTLVHKKLPDAAS